MISPLVAKAFFELDRAVQLGDPVRVIFPSREGWFLRSLWKRCQAMGVVSSTQTPSLYLYANRRILNRTQGIWEPNRREAILGRPFSGTLDSLLYSRFGIKPQLTTVRLAELGITSKQWIELPRDQVFTHATLLTLLGHDEIRDDFERSRSSYMRYLRASLGDEQLIYFDLGYSGSVAGSLSELLDRQIHAVFFQSHLPHLDQSSRTTIHSALTPPQKPDSPLALGPLAIILEGIFRAPERGLLDFDVDAQPIFDTIQEVDDDHFRLLEEIVEGIFVGLIAHLSRPEEQVDELVRLLLLMARVGSLPVPRDFLERLSVDDSYSGIATLSVSETHRLKIVNSQR